MDTHLIGARRACSASIRVCSVRISRTGGVAGLFRNFSIGVIACAGLSACADSQFSDNGFKSLAPVSTGSTTAAGGKEWSGRSGASGHPAMTADAVRTAAADFPSCIARLEPAAARRGISQQDFVRFTSGLTPDLRLMDLMDAQPEFTKAFWDYLDTLVTEARIRRGREMLARYDRDFDAVERSYGVDRHVLAAIWGVETNFGSQGGDRPVLRSTATLACVGRRQAYFREEFLSALEIVSRGDVNPDHFKGSWAGAFGPTQFMPTTFKRHAVDFDGDGRRDIVDSIPDVLASMANKLRADGWIAGAPWGYEVSVPRGFDYLKAGRSHQMTLAQWSQLGVRRADGGPLPSGGDTAYLMVPAGAKGPAFLMFQNFRAIMRYNPSEAYALAIGHLADRMRGGGPFVRPWPRQERVLSRNERLELQRHLASRGHDIGEADGRLGPASRHAIMKFQAAQGLPPDGFATASLLDRLRAN